MSTGKNSSRWFGTEVPPGTYLSTSFGVSENYSGSSVEIPAFVWRGEKDGPTVFITAAVHGDEINGTGVIRRLIRNRPFELLAGTLVLLPVVNLLGFERHTRYLPDRRDLNRSFPGSPNGSAAARMAWAFFEEVFIRCDYGIDLHTAAVRRTNFPNVRADMSNKRLAAFARAFGADLIVNGKGPKGSLRQSASKAGCATLILEAGEVWKVESGVVEYATRGITNCLQFLGMVQGKPEEPPYRVETDASKWVRASQGGFLEFHVGPGDIFAKDEAIATNTDLTGDDQNVILAPRDGIVLGMTTIPSVAPGDPVCHLAYPRKGVTKKISRVVDHLGGDSLHERMRDDLASSVHLTDPKKDESSSS